MYDSQLVLCFPYLQEGWKVFAGDCLISLEEKIPPSDDHDWRSVPDVRWLTRLRYHLIQSWLQQSRDFFLPSDLY